MLADFGRKLTIGHLVGRFEFDSQAPKFLTLDVLVEFPLGFTGTKNQDGRCSMKSREDFLIEFLTIGGEFSLLPIFRNKVIGRVLGLRTHSRRPSRRFNA